MSRATANLQVVSSPPPDDRAPRYASGWRRGKPEEDPDKLKRWGWITARPSEFLVRMRGGRVVASGQGATAFKWPWDSVAVIPTTVQRLQFTADQISREKAGVRVTGIVVYRLAEPLIAFRMLNFSYPERAQEKLAVMMEEMCLGAVRRLVANLSVEECLTRRKDALATELVREIAPVVSGSGRPEDSTARGWGVVVDTIEIQDVRVLSQAVFAHMQARFRNELEQGAREAELARERAVKADEAATARQVELSRVASAEAAQREQLASKARVEAQRQEVERATRQEAIASERALALARLEAEEEVRQRRQAAWERAQLEQLAAESRLAQEKLRAQVEATRVEAEAELARHQAALEREGQQAERLRAEAQAARARLELAQLQASLAELEVHQREVADRLELEHAAWRKQIENTLSPEVIQLTLAQQLPEVARAFQQQMGEVHVTAVDGANPFGYIAAAVEGVLGLARSAGLAAPQEPSGRASGSKEPV